MDRWNCLSRDGYKSKFAGIRDQRSGVRVGFQPDSKPDRGPRPGADASTLYMAPATHLGFEYMVFGLAGNRRFLSLGGPGGPNSHSRRGGASPPALWVGVWGRQCRPNPENRRCPAGPKTRY